MQRAKSREEKQDGVKDQKNKRFRKERKEERRRGKRGTKRKAGARKSGAKEGRRNRRKKGEGKRRGKREEEEKERRVGGRATLTPHTVNCFLLSFSPTSWKPVFTGASSKFTQLIPRGSNWAL